MKRFQVRQYTTHYRSLTALGLPIIIGQTGTILLSCADTLMIGHHSTNELAAAAFVNNMFNLVLLFGLGFSYGLTPIVGNLFGRDEATLIGASVKNALAANTVLALLLGGVVEVFYANIGNLGQPTELLPLMRPYLLVLFISLPFVCWFNVFKQFSDGITDTRTPMWILLGGNILNIIGNYLLIYGKLGLPELGLLGAGISTTLSRVIMTIVFVAMFFLSKRYHIYRVGFKQGRVNRTFFTEQNKLGWPLALQMGMESAAFSLSSVMVGWIGATALAAHQIMLTISQFFFLVYYGVGAAVAVRISYFNGQRDYTAARNSAIAGFHLVLLIALAVSLPVGLSRNSIGYLFSDSTAVCHLVAMTIIVLIIYQFGDGLQCIYSNALRGLSDVKPLMYVAFFAYFVVSLPLSYLFGITLDMGLVGIWLAFPFGLTVAGLLYYIAFKRHLGRLINK
ncbi:MATE family efflux transporter [Hoylesella enoeca]|uniref:MATE family efflux transporter n=1 Tax=Hoylesella enoeca TaxID=76123 RepID=UPI00288A3F76|nr:MATE family efflux transporter [Hoylesella enoeca]